MAQGRPPPQPLPPPLEVRAAGAADRTATLTLLQDAIEAETSCLIKRITLECLVDRSVHHLAPGRFAVHPVHLPQLGAEVRRACREAGPAALASFQQYGEKLKTVLDDLQDLVTRQDLPNGSSLALLRADTLVARLARQGPAGGGGGSAGSSAGSWEEEEGEEGLLAPRSTATSSSGGGEGGHELLSLEAGSAVQQIVPLVFELHSEDLPFRLSSMDASNVRYALGRCLSAKRITQQAGGLGQAALAALLRVSHLEGASPGTGAAAAGAAAFQLGPASVQHVQRALQDGLARQQRGAAAAAALAAEFEAEYSSDVEALLARHPGCARLVHLGTGPAGQPVALLRGDLVLGPRACTVAGPLPVPHPSTPEATDGAASSKQGGQQVQQGGARPQQGRKAQQAQQGGGRRTPLQRTVAAAQVAEDEEEDLDLPPGFGGPPRPAQQAQQHKAGAGRGAKAASGAASQRATTAPAVPVARQPAAPQARRQQGQRVHQARPQPEAQPVQLAEQGVAKGTGRSSSSLVRPAQVPLLRLNASAAAKPPLSLDAQRAQRAAWPEYEEEACLPLEQKGSAVAPSREERPTVSAGPAGSAQAVEVQALPQREPKPARARRAKAAPPPPPRPQQLAAQAAPAVQPPEAAAPAPQHQPTGPRRPARKQGEEGSGAAAGRGPMALMQRLQGGRAAGIDGRLAGSFMAVHLNKPPEQQRAEAAMLEALLGGSMWEEAKSFMETALRLSGLAPGQGTK